MGLSFGYGPRNSDVENQKFLTHAADNGCTFWDTADIYGYGCNEGSLPRCFALTGEMVGTWFKNTGRRNEIFLATKFGHSLDGKHTLSGKPEYVKKASVDSLKRLGMDRIDLYYLHRYSFFGVLS